MYYLPTRSYDPYFNLALEEYVFKSLQIPCLLLWQNKPTVVVGRFQNTEEEINKEFIKQQQIQVVRRNTGGGAVYHDLGNLNFTFIKKSKTKKLDFRQFTEPVLEALATIGILAEYSGRNDLLIKGKKFSGNAQYHWQGQTMHHGTLLFATNLADMAQALQVQDSKLAVKGIQSVRSRVTNISEHLTTALSLAEFKALLLKHLFTGEIKEYTLTTEDLRQIICLRNEKYCTAAWNYGHSPLFNYKKRKRFAGGELVVCLYLDQGVIQKCKFYGDFFTNEDLGELEQKIAGQPYCPVVFTGLLAELNMQKYFKGISPLEFKDLFFS